MQEGSQQTAQLSSFNNGIESMITQLRSLQATVNQNAANITILQTDTATNTANIAKHDQRLAMLEETVASDREHHDASIADIQRQLTVIQRSMLTSSAGSPAPIDAMVAGQSYAGVASSSPGNMQPQAAVFRGPPTSVDLAVQMFGKKSVQAFQQQQRYMTVIAQVPLQHIEQTTDHKQPASYGPADFERDFRAAAEHMRFAKEFPEVTRACFSVDPLTKYVGKTEVHIHTISYPKKADGGSDDEAMPTADEQSTTHYHYVLTFRNDIFIKTLHERYAAPLAIHMNIKIKHNLIKPLDDERKKYMAIVYPRAKELKVGYSLAANGVHPALRHPFSREYTQVHSVQEALEFLQRVEAEKRHDGDNVRGGGGDAEDNGEAPDRNVRARVSDGTASVAAAADGQRQPSSA